MTDNIGSTNKRGSRPNSSFTNQEKLKYIELLESGKKKAIQICNEHNIPKSTLSTWVKARASIRAAVQKGKANGCRQRKTKNDSLDEALLNWFDEMEGVSGQMILDKAGELASALDSEPVSRSWIDRWKKRNGICSQEICDNSKASKVYYRKTSGSAADTSSFAIFEISEIDTTDNIDDSTAFNVDSRSPLGAQELMEDNNTEQNMSAIKQEMESVDLDTDSIIQEEGRDEREACVKAISDLLNKHNGDVLTELRQLISQARNKDENKRNKSLELSKGSIQDLATDDPMRQLMQAAMDMREKAYCPYSHFRVGAAVISPDKSIYSGCNVENASYGLTMCAERVAIGNAVSDGCQRFSHMAVCCDVKESFKGPCGACRQVLVEFGTDWSLYCVKPNGDFMQVSINELLPMGFHPSALREERV